MNERPHRNRGLIMAARVKTLIHDEVSPWFSSRELKPLPQQAREVVALWRRYRMAPYHYLKHRLYERSADARIEAYVPPEIVKRFQLKANPASAIAMVADKWRTAEVLRSHGVAVVPELLIIGARGELSAAGQEIDLAAAVELLRLCPFPLFAKPVAGGVGAGTCEIAPADVTSAWLSPLRGYLIQPKLRNHPVLDTFYSRSLNTVRIDVLVWGDEVVLNAACLKVGMANAIADNWALGSIAIGIDLETGKLAPRGVRKAKYGRALHEAHPETGVAFAAVEIPFWPEVRRLVTHAARALKPLVTLGWDVAITPDGPIILEANETGDFFLLQEACGPLAGTKLAEAALAQHLGSID